MLLRKWEDLPEKMKNEKVRPYYDLLQSKRASLIGKSIFDKIMAAILLALLSPVFLMTAVWIKLDSKGTVFFRQTRVTQYGAEFKIYKFRTMVENAEAIGAQVTSQNDLRVTAVGKVLRKYRLDEIPQLLNILQGEMSFVGTRPEVPKYVGAYTEEMMATLLLPAGVTSETSIQYKDEEKLLKTSDNTDEIYMKAILPDKMKWNLKSLKSFTLLNEINITIRTVFAIVEK